ncbi:MAG: endonuclease/exonuclease/phosphatase family protein [Coxiellaceae bacterium]|nr:endonuclease/exonuclease/phosphatase family protein [Coxiellaceae bacterium]
MTFFQKSVLLFLFGIIVTGNVFADAGDVKFINHSQETFVLTAESNAQKAKQLGLPAVIQSDTDQNYYLSLSDANVGEHYDYATTDGKLHFSIDVKSTQTNIYHHVLRQTVDYLTVNWGNVLQNSNIHYVLPLFWKDDSYESGQQVRVDADNNAIIGLFSEEPKNALTVMSYNTDKDGTGSDHDPQYHQFSDILGLFTSGRIPTPDVLMIQEGLGAEDAVTYQQTLAALAMGKWYSYYATEGTRLDSNIILVNPKYNATQIQSGSIVFKNQCGWGLVGARNAAYVDIPASEILQDTVPGNVRIFDTHLESGRDGDIFSHAAQVRMSQFNEILNYPRTNVASLIVAGDFNTMSVFDETTGLTQYQLGDLTTVFDKYMGDPNVNWGQPITCTWAVCTQYTFNTGMWLDRMYTTAQSIPGYKTYVLYPFVGHQANGYSDHLPVWVTLYYEKNTA